VDFDLRHALKQIVSGEVTLNEWESQLAGLGLDLASPIGNLRVRG
jgi:hypothetical protein